MVMEGRTIEGRTFDVVVTVEPEASGVWPPLPAPVFVPRGTAARPYVECDGSDPETVRFHGPYEGLTVTAGQELSPEAWARFHEAAAWALSALGLESPAADGDSGAIGS